MIDEGEKMRAFGKFERHWKERKGGEYWHGIDSVRRLRDSERDGNIVQIGGK